MPAWAARLRHVPRVAWRSTTTNAGTATVPAVLQELAARGCIAAMTDANGIARLLSGRAGVYCGFDPTAPTLHVGNLVAVLALVRLFQAGHRVVGLVGGATGLIGDPSGRQDDRVPLSPEAVETNTAGIAEVLQRIRSHAEEFAPPRETGSVGGEFTVLNNMEWYRHMSAVDFVRQVGGSFRLGAMLAKESVKVRLDSPQGMAFTEFTYQVFQAYDFLYLHRSHGVQLQVGGSDQWGNITAGSELIRRTLGPEHPAYGLTLPLVTTADGTKLGKSMGNAVWLEASYTSPYDLYQFFLNTADADVGRLLNLLTLLPSTHVADIMSQQLLKPEARPAQRALANHVTELVHGAEGLSLALNATSALFSAEFLHQVTPEQTEQLFAGAPRHALPKARLVGDVDCGIADILVEVGLVSSRKEAKQTIKAGGAYVNNMRVNATTRLSAVESTFADSSFTLVRKGRKHQVLIQWT